MMLGMKNLEDEMHFKEELEKFIKAYQLEWGGIPKGEILIFSVSELSDWDYKKEPDALVVFNEIKADDA